MDHAEKLREKVSGHLHLNATMQNSKFSVLDGMRGIAALFILTRHTESFWGIWLYKSYLAVDLFFILSGFVIAHAYARKLHDRVITNRQFFFIRIIRLSPVYLISLALALGVSLFTAAMDSHPVEPAQILASAALALFFLPSYIPGVSALFPLNGPTWSLFFELIANFLYAVSRPWLGERLMLALLGVLGLLLCFYSFGNGGLDSGFTWGLRSIGAGLTRCCFGFLFGLYLHKNRARFKSISGIFMTICPPIFGLVIVLTLPDLHRFNWLADVLCVSAAFPLFVLLASRAHQVPFESWLLALGSASYPIYVLHYPLGNILTSLFPDVIAKNAPMSGIVLVLLLVPATILLERRIDMPIRQYLSRVILGKGR